MDFGRYFMSGILSILPLTDRWSTQFFYPGSFQPSTLSVFENGQEERATCFSILLQKKMNSDVAHVTTHESNLSRNERGSHRLGKVVAEGRDYVYFLQQTLVHAARFTGSRQTCFAACMAWLPRNFIQPEVSIHTNLLARQIWTCKTSNIAFLLEERYWFNTHFTVKEDLQCNW